MKKLLNALRLMYFIGTHIQVSFSYVLWMMLLYPLRLCNSDLYWTIERKLYYWIHYMIGFWCSSGQIKIIEIGDSLEHCINKPTLVICNHQSYCDVPFLMTAFASRNNIMQNAAWIMDSIFKFTHFGAVSLMHGDFFLNLKLSERKESLKKLSQHLKQEFSSRNRKWIVLFPEGSFLYKKKEKSQLYAKKQGLRHLENVALPRTGALQTILDTCNSGSDIDTVRMEFILDVTVAYPNGEIVKPLELIFGNTKSVDVILYYRLYPISEVPLDEKELTNWIYNRYYEKEQCLSKYYETGQFGGSAHFGESVAQTVHQSRFMFILMDIFFIVSSYVFYTMFCYLIYFLCI